MKGGSAVQMFSGFDTRQIKVSAAKDSSTTFDFKSVMNEKSTALQPRPVPRKHADTNRQLNAKNANPNQTAEHKTIGDQKSVDQKKTSASEQTQHVYENDSPEKSSSQ